MRAVAPDPFGLDGPSGGGSEREFYAQRREAEKQEAIDAKVQQLKLQKEKETSNREREQEVRVRRPTHCGICTTPCRPPPPAAPNAWLHTARPLTRAVLRHSPRHSPRHSSPRHSSPRHSSPRHSLSHVRAWQLNKSVKARVGAWQREKKNLRALLASLHEIAPPCSWQPVTLAVLLDPSAVKKV